MIFRKRACFSSFKEAAVVEEFLVHRIELAAESKMLGSLGFAAQPVQGTVKDGMGAISVVDLQLDVGRRMRYGEGSLRIGDGALEIVAGKAEIGKAKERLAAAGIDGKGAGIAAQCLLRLT